MLPETWTILKLLTWTTDYFKSHHIEQPRVDAEVLLAHVLGMTRLDLYVMYDRPLERDELDVFKGLIRRRARREPVAYILGRKEFWSMTLKITPDVLVPRPETEVLVETALQMIPQRPLPAPWHVLDLGTGSGAIILAIASERPGHRFWGIDRSEKALAVARENARLHELQNHITWRCADWFDVGDAEMGLFHLIVSNPPYIPSSCFEGLAPEIVEYEPRQALDGGPEGLDAIRIILDEAPNHLVAGGSVILEIGHDQWPAVEDFIQASGRYGKWGVVRDYSGFDRVAWATT